MIKLFRIFKESTKTYKLRELNYDVVIYDNLN
jgi:hypothetical protein